MAASEKEGFPLSHPLYTHCKTRTVDLEALDLPGSATDEVYRRIYHSYTQFASPGSNASHLRDAIESIKQGIAPPVAFPTETVYGLGADATNAPAVSGIFAAKGRPNDNPLIAHVSSSEHLQRVTGSPVPDIYKPVVSRFWPGPLTILLPIPPNSQFAPNVHPGQSTIGFRMPSSKYARFFIAACDKPIAGPSANSSGKPSPTTARHVMDDLKSKINFILDGGNCDVGVESTVVDGLHDPPLILRPGGVSLEELRSVGGPWADTVIGYKTHHSPSNPSTPASASDQQYLESTNGAPRAPGMKYRHYSPSAKLVLFSHAAVQNGRVEEYLSTFISTNNITQQQQPAGPDKSKIKRVGILSWALPLFLGVPLSFSVEPNPGSNLLSAQDLEVMKNSHYEECIAPAGYGDEGGSHVLIFNIGVQPRITDLARDLFSVLRLFDDLECDYIFAEVVMPERRYGMMRFDRTGKEGEEGEGGGGMVEGRRGSGSGELWEAVADRLGKAASEKVDE